MLTIICDCGKFSAKNDGEKIYGLRGIAELIAEEYPETTELIIQKSSIPNDGEINCDGLSIEEMQQLIHGIKSVFGNNSEVFNANPEESSNY